MNKPHFEKALAGAFLFLCALAGAADPVHVVRKGEGPLVLFLAGLNVHGEVWQPWVDALAAEHRVVQVTAAGFGGVPATDLEAGFLGTLVPALSRLLEEEQAQDATVVGHSLGGLAALMLAADEPARVGRLLVVDSLPFLAELFLPGTTPADAATMAEAMADRSAALAPAAYLAQTEAAVGSMTKTPVFMERLRSWAHASDRATATQAFQETLSADFRPALPSIRQPVHVLAAWDASMPLSKADVEALYLRQYAGLRNHEVLVVENSLHFVMIDQPVAFDTALATVLAR